MKLKSLKDEIFDTMLDAVKDSICNLYHTANARVITTDGHINLYLTDNGVVEAEVVHDDYKRHKDFNLERFCEKVISAIKWGDVKKEVSEEDVTPEQEYAHRGEMMFAPSMRWHRI